MKEEEPYEFYRENYILAVHEINELKAKIDKAIELIEKRKSVFTKDIVITNVINEVLNKLKGRDKE